MYISTFCSHYSVLLQTCIITDQLSLNDPKTTIQTHKFPPLCFSKNFQNMSAPPYTTLWRCRMKDLIKCFYACKVQTDDHDQDERRDEQCSSSPEIEGRGSDMRGSGFKGGETTGKKEKEGEESESMSWPSCEEEEYIVFCFRDDGGVHVIEERGSVSSFSRSTAGTTAAAAVNRRKVKFVKEQGGVYVTNGRDKLILNEQKYGRRDGILVDANLMPPNKPPEVNEMKEQETGEHKKTSSESSNSSTSSFSFPILQGGWTGSPVLMPRPDGHKSKSVCVQCCKF